MAKRRKKPERTESQRALRRLGIFIISLLVFLLYAYATDATEVNLEKPQNPQRQAVVTRVLRALARPDFLEYDEEIRAMSVGIRIPCGETVSDFEFGPDSEGRSVRVSPNCVTTTQDTIKIFGTGFRPRTSGIIRWHPPGDTSTTRALSSFRTDADGTFEADFEMPDIRPSEELQRLEIEEKWRTGITGLSEASKTTIEKIIETIFLALMATTVGTILAVPISFLAARNLMSIIGSPLASVMSGVIAIPIGAFIGSSVTRFVLDASARASEQTVVGLGIFVVAIAASIAIIRLGPPVFEAKEPTTRESIIAWSRVIASALIGFFGIGILANLGVEYSQELAQSLGIFAFVGNFLSLVFEAIIVLFPGIVALILALVAASFGSRYGQEAVLRVNDLTARILTIITTSIGAALIVFGIGRFLNWLYVFDEPRRWTTYPAIAAVVIAFIGTLFIQPKRQFPIGMIIYMLIRSLLNIIRSIEPLIYVIVFAVWVGIGPFAGILALTIHTIAALGKLFSEQVENISEGPLEAITATGATGLQTIAFAVIPQIVPPYIAFTLYRWDINVRMSTILGFGGGGGIGFVLVQAINLLEYRKASVMMIAIAIVVMTLDYVSSQIRQRII